MTNGNGDDHRGVLATWKASFEQHQGSADLPAHHPQCLGCGPDNPHGHHLTARRSDERVVAEHVFDARHVGAPGIAHGGAVATVLDDLFGFLLYVVGSLAVTRSINVDYFSPVLLGETYALSAELTRRDGRKLFMASTIQSQDRTVAKAEAVFIAVDIEHFAGTLDAGAR